MHIGKLSIVLLPRHVPGGRPRHRRAAADRSAVPQGEAHPRQPAVVDASSRRELDRRERRHDATGRWSSSSFPRPAQLSRSSARAERPHKGPKLRSPRPCARSSRATASSPTTITPRRGATVARNLNVSVFKGFDTYRGTRAVQRTARSRSRSYEPFRADMQTRFQIDGGMVQLERHRPAEPRRRRPRSTGYVDLGNWPEMLYNVRSRDRLPDQKGIYFKDMNFTVAGHGDFTGTFHFFKSADRRAEGHVHQPRGRRQRVAVSQRHGSLLWVPTTLPRHRRHDRALRRPREVRLPDGAVRTAGDPAQARVGRDVHRRRSVAADRLPARLQGIRLAGRATGHNRLEWPLGQVRAEARRGGGHRDDARRRRRR